jgi:hypothetical protein
MDGRVVTPVAEALRAFLGSPVACKSVGALRPARFSAQMLREDRVAEVDASAADAAPPPTAGGVFHGLRGGSSYVEQLADVACEWYMTRKDPVTHRAELEDIGLLPAVPSSVGSSSVISVDTSSSQRIQQVRIEVLDTFVHAAIENYTEEHQEDPMCVVNAATRSFVDALGGARGLLTLLGHAKTVGSVAVAPLTRTQCIDSFQRRWSVREPLSVGARALAKHCQRVVSSDSAASDDSTSAWGESELRGNDASKNARALEVLTRLLDDAVWKNMHALPPFSEEISVVTMEVRDSRGYGARWEIRGSGDGDASDGESGFTFRGFLEPPMADGHERRWRH